MSVDFEGLKTTPPNQSVETINLLSPSGHSLIHIVNLILLPVEAISMDLERCHGLLHMFLHQFDEHLMVIGLVSGPLTPLLQGSKTLLLLPVYQY